MCQEYLVPQQCIKVKVMNNISNKNSLKLRESTYFQIKCSSMT